MATINKHIILIVISTLSFVNITLSEDGQHLNLTGFYQNLEEGSDKQAVQIGQKIFEHIERKHRTDAGFGALKSKMAAADFLADQMVTQLRKANSRRMFAVAEELFEDGTKDKNRSSLSVVPAKSFYETSLKIFAAPVNINGLEDEEKKFLAKFYDLKLRILTTAIAKAGQALAIAESDFKGTYDSVLVLPLLHASEGRPVNIDVLPKWMRQSSQLSVFSDSALLHYGLAYHSQTFARAAAELEQKEFSQEKFYRIASQKCVAQLPHVAVDCLKRANDLIDGEKIDEKISLQFDIVQIWLDSKNFTLAAGEAKKITESFPNHKRNNEAIWLYFYALSRSNNVEAILANIDNAISDPQCSDYKAKLMYMKWWALRRQGNQEALIAAIEHNLLKEYGNNKLVAPIMLSRATDLLACQDYNGAFAILEQLQEKFPSTKASQQAQKIVQKLKNIRGLN